MQLTDREEKLADEICLKFECLQHMVYRVYVRGKGHNSTPQ